MNIVTALPLHLLMAEDESPIDNPLNAAECDMIVAKAKALDLVIDDEETVMEELSRYPVSSMDAPRVCEFMKQIKGKSAGISSEALALALLCRILDWKRLTFVATSQLHSVYDEDTTRHKSSD